jgi:hypothetical protein
MLFLLFFLLFFLLLEPVAIIIGNSTVMALSTATTITSATSGF